MVGIAVEGVRIGSPGSGVGWVLGVGVEYSVGVAVGRCVDTMDGT